MKTTIQTTTTLTAALAFALFASGCGESETGDSGGSGGYGDAGSQSQSESADPAIEAAFVESEPENAISVREARKKAQPGDEIVVAGKIAGAISPFVDGYATVVLADRGLRTCDMTEDDRCPTPWDACCVDPDTIKASCLTIQVVGEDGRPVAQSLEGVRGLKEMDELVVSGAVAEGSTKKNLILNVEKLYRKG